MTENWQHPPAPGSARHAVASASEHYTPPAHQVAAPQPGHAQEITPVPVTGLLRVATSDEAVYRTTTLPPSQARQLVPQDPHRYLFYVLAVDNPVVLCATKELAQDAANQATGVPAPTGFYLPAGIPVPLRSKGLVWAANTSASATSRISVIIERYEHPARSQ